MIVVSCVVGGCPRKPVGRGLCSMHWQRDKRRGTPGGPEPVRHHDLTEAFLASTSVSPSGCWLWTGATAGGGYGHVRWKAMDRVTHRLAYELIVGPIPEGMTIDHECHNLDPNCPGDECEHRLCWNPAHLVPRPIGENVKRGLRGRRPGPPRASSCLRCGAADWYVASDGSRRCRPCRAAWARSRRR